MRGLLHLVIYQDLPSQGGTSGFDSLWVCE